ncbi:MAG: hypothetical protein RLP44_26905 [Aggregatilineales bacterium]
MQSIESSSTSTISPGQLEATRIIKEATQRAINATQSPTATQTISVALLEATSTSQEATRRSFDLTATVITLTPTSMISPGLLEATRIIQQATLRAISATETAYAPTSTSTQSFGIRNENLLDDSSYLTGIPCGTPCWQGIIPGETTFSDALSIIENSEEFTDLEVRANEDTDLVGAFWSPIDGESCCQMYSTDGVTVDIIILQTTPDEMLGQVIEQFGDPTYLFGETLNDNEGVVTLFYPENLMLIYVFINGEAGEVSATSEIVGFAYFTQSRMELLTLTNDLHEWQGYQSYTAYMDSEFEVTPSVTLTPYP